MPLYRTLQMFRQIKIHPDDRNFQRILWRNSPDEGMYMVLRQLRSLALRVLLQLAEDEEYRFPLGTQIIRLNSYIDDIFAGADTLSQALEV